MIKNYLRIAVRHLLRQPGYAGLNIFGLTLGMVSSLLIVLYLFQELSFDSHHQDADRIFRICSRITETDDAFNWASTQVPLGRTVKETFGEVDQYVRFVPSQQTRLAFNNISYNVENLYLADSTVFDVFNYEFVQGDPGTALDEPNAICLSASEAQRIFKGENPMGQLLETDNNSYKVTGVFADQPTNSHIIPNALASLSTARQLYTSENWGSFFIYSYIKLNPQADPQVVEDKLNKEIMERYVSVIFDQFNVKVTYDLMAIRDIHLKSDYEGEPVPLGSMDYIYIFAVVAIFLIGIACINYMNLATARSMRRALEVGIRKVMGAKRGMLIGQFIAESVIIALLSLVLSVLLLILLVPSINAGLGTSLDIQQLLTPQIILIILAILVFTGFLSGSYPAFYLSAFTPSKSLRGGGSSKAAGNRWLRRALVGLQFAISIFMLISTFIIYDQMQFVRSKDLGFDKNQVATFLLRGASFEKWDVLKNQLLQNPNILEVATASTIPGNGYGKNLTSVENKDGVMDDYGVNLFQVDFDYFNTLGVDIVQGRNFSLDYATDTSQAVIINEAMVARFGWDDPIGKRFQFDQDSTVFHRVIGVAKDFHHLSLYNPIEPLMFVPNLNNRNVLIRIESNYQATVADIERTWNELFPNLPFESEFLDQNFVGSYEDDQIRGNLFLGFSFMMIVIASLGLLGLASFTAEQRSKEISIRKVLGASIQGLIGLLVKEFVWLVLLGAIPAFVFAYLFANNWLQEFQYHVDINFLLFVAVTFIILMVTVSTTGYHALRAAQANPTENLKNE